MDEYIFIRTRFLRAGILERIANHDGEAFFPRLEGVYVAQFFFGGGKFVFFFFFRPIVCFCAVRSPGALGFTKVF